MEAGREAKKQRRAVIRYEGIMFSEMSTLPSRGSGQDDRRDGGAVATQSLRRGCGDNVAKVLMQNGNLSRLGASEQI